MNYLETKSNTKIKCIAVLLTILMILLSQIMVMQADTNTISGHEADIKPIKISNLRVTNIVPEISRTINTAVDEVKYENMINTTVITDRNIVGEINSNSDLSPMRTVTADELNTILDYWSDKSGTNTFRDQGQVFIDASKQSGLDPVYLIAHAAIESKWGQSEIAVDKTNYFGIGAYDHNPYHGSYVMGSSFSEGIISGAKWISENYYQHGQTSLYRMRYNNGSHEYCTSDTWVNSITELIITSYNLIN